MKKNKSSKRDDAPDGNSGSPRVALDSVAGRRPVRAALVWLAIVAVSVLLTGCSRFDGFYAAFLGVSLAILAGELAFLKAIWKDGKSSLYLGWKKFTGYSLPVWYFFHALPRIGWGNAELIGPGREIFLFALTLAATTAGMVTFLFAERPSALEAAGVITAREAGDRALRKERMRTRKPRGAVAWILDWVDAIGWAVIAVLLVNIFVFQLYEVPSESMVPTFLGGDRPFTLKATFGPRVPLTEWRLPFLRLPRRGDVVTIANPRYQENHRVDVKKYVSQFVYMITLTGVRLDSTLPDGTPKADPLVKRIVGVPGEKLMMVDDVLYARTREKPEFRKVPEPWAAVDLWKKPSELKSRIRQIPVDERTRAVLSRWDARKNSASPSELAAEIESSFKNIETHLERLTAFGRGSDSVEELSRVDSGLRDRKDEAIRAASNAENVYAAKGAASEDLSLILAAADSSEARDDLRAYARGALKAAETPAANAYEKGSRVLNLLIKLNLLRRMERDLILITDGSGFEELGSDAERTKLLTEARELYLYIQGFYDSRNFPEFPEGAGFLAPDEYFAMGDNRYNSLDFRFEEKPGIRALDPEDPTSTLYTSILKPFPLKLKFIEGHALFRLWPLSRMGRIR